MDQLSLVAEHCAASGHTFAFQNAEILGRGTDQTARETLEAWHTVPTSINRCTILPAAYQALRVRFNQRNQRQEVSITSPGEHSSRPNTDDGGQQADKGETGKGPAATEVHTGRGKRATITRNAGQAQQMRAMQTRSMTVAIPTQPTRRGDAGRGRPARQQLAPPPQQILHE
nr:unnamed protein product [Spirometra erinaceieuropaei]